MKAISLQQAVNAVLSGRVALPGELAGYVVLVLVGELQPITDAITVPEIKLLEDGSVRFERETDSVRSVNQYTLRQLLGRLLDISTSVSRGLKCVSQGNEQGYDTLARELETALIPLNRSAAKRGISRLYREVTRLGTSNSSLDVPLCDEVHESLVESPQAFESLDLPITSTEFEDLSASSMPASVRTDEPVADIPELEVPEKRTETKTEGELYSSDEPRAVTLVLAEVAPIVESNDHVEPSAPEPEVVEPCAVTFVLAEVVPIVESNDHVEPSAPEAEVVEPRTVTLVLAEVAPIIELNDCVEPSAPEAEIVESRTVTLVLAEVAPIIELNDCVEPSAPEAEVVELFDAQISLEPDLRIVPAVEPETELSIPLPLVKRRVSNVELSSDSVREDSVREDSSPRCSSESDVVSADDRTSIETIVAFRDEDHAVEGAAWQAAWEPVELLSEVAVTVEPVDVSPGAHSKPEVTVWIDEELGDDLSHEMTVIPLGGYELSYIEPRLVIRSAKEPSVNAYGLRVARATVYRNPSSFERRPVRSDAERLVTQLDDGSFWDAVELRRDLQALAGVDATYTPQPAEVPGISSGTDAKIRAIQSR